MADRTAIRALIVEDCDDDVVLLTGMLRKAGFDLTFSRVDSRDALVDALSVPWDIVLSDYSLPAFNGRDALQIVRQQDPDVPFFFVSGTMGEDRAVEAMRFGAQDYFLKGNLKRLASAIVRELSEASRRRLHRQTEERVRYLANHDTLTGLPNRSRLTEWLEQALVDRQRMGERIALVTVNVNRFRDINDHLGTAAGDTLLRELAQRLAAVAGPQDIIARLSADEFAIAIEQPGTGGSPAMVESILASLAQPFLLSGYEWRITASIGSAVFPADGLSCDALIANSAMALRRAKASVGSCHVRYSEGLRQQLQARVAMRRALEQALERSEFRLHYQAQVALETCQVTGAEALIRWDRPGIGSVPPDLFIPLAEETGLIVPIGRWVMREACRQIRQWREEGLPEIRVAINFSAYQFRQPNLIDELGAQLSEYGVSARSLAIEITETALMHDPELARSVLQRLRKMEFSVALDDFGTGYSSLSYLRQFPVDVLKIDRKFIGDIVDDQGTAIVEAIIALAEKLNLAVVAEGVETATQLSFLKAAGCSAAQGYYLQRPGPPSEMAPLIAGACLLCDDRSSEPV